MNDTVDIPRRLHSGEEPSYGRDTKDYLLKYLRVGMITRVDNERGLVDLAWLDSVGEYTNVPLPAAYSSLRSGIRSMPETGEIVICGWRRKEQKIEMPVIIGFLNLDYETAKKYQLIRNKAPEILQEIKQERKGPNGEIIKEVSIREKIGYGSVRAKTRKLYPGEIQVESTQGSEIYLDDNVYLSNSKLNEIEIVAADQSIRLSARQEYHNTSASRISNGMITRVPVEGEEILQPTILANGQKIQIITDANNPYHLGGKAFNEYRIEVYDKSDGRVPVTEVNSGYDISAVTPNTTLLIGTLVGNDKSDVQRYSKVLRPQIFGTPDAIDVGLNELECLPEEYNSLAGAFQLKMSSGAKFDIDKQGHLFSNLPSSTDQHPLGAGRSWEGHFAGSIKWVIGANNAKNRSFILDTKGGIKETLGFDSENQRSRETIAQKSIYTEVLAPDDNDDAFVVKTTGNVRYDVTGNYLVNVSGSYTITVSGKIQENILGTKNENYINDKNVIYGGNFKEVTVKDKQELIGGTREVIISGVTVPPTIPPDGIVDKLKIVLGTREETYTIGHLKRKFIAGDMTADLTAGNVEENIILGDNISKITTGDLKEEVTLGDNTNTVDTGNIEETVILGNDITTVTTGNIKEIVATGNIEESVTLGDIKGDVATGDIKENIVAGSNETSVTTGDIKESVSAGNNEETIIAGNKSITITTGNYELSITGGNIDVKTLAGTINIDSTTNKVDLNGLLQVTVKSGVKLKMTAPQCVIGAIPARGGVVCGTPGIPSTLCYLTGAPHIGSATVKSSL